MTIQEIQQGAVIVLKPVGPLTEADAGTFKERARAAATKNLGRIIVDAEGIAFIDSHGLEALADITEQLSDGGRNLKLSGTPATLKQVLELTGWANMFEFFDDTNTAVRSFL